MRIAIVGSGISGLGAAWLLDGRHQIVLMEKERRLGGNAHTVNLDVQGSEVAIDLGAQYLSEGMYPCILRLFKRLDVPLRKSPVTSTFYDAASGWVLPLSFYPSVVHAQRLLRLRSLAGLSLFGAAMSLASKLEAQGDWCVTLEEFAGNKRLPQRFTQMLLYPFLAALQGATLESIRGYSARAAFKYPVLHIPPRPFAPFPMLEVEGGLGAYVQRLAATLTTTRIRLGCGVESIRKSPDALVVRADDGSEEAFDRVIVATPAHAAAKMVNGAPDGRALSAVLRRFSYMRCVIGIHTDPSRLPADRKLWASTNFISDRKKCALTIAREARPGAPVFKSWITDGPSANALLASQEYWHVLPTPEHYAAQRALWAHQGKHGLFFAGAHTQDVDSHESGLLSAMAAVRDIDPLAPRLRELNPEYLGRAAA